MRHIVNKMMMLSLLPMLVLFIIKEFNTCIVTLLVYYYANRVKMHITRDSQSAIQTLKVFQFHK